MPLDPAKIAAAQAARALTDDAAARRAGMQQPNWSRLKSGRVTDPRLSTAERVAAALGVPLASLVASPRRPAP